MTITAEKSPTQTPEIEVRSLIQDLGRRVGFLWECDRYIASAEGRPELQEYWRVAKSREQQSIDQLKKLLE